MVEKKNNPPQSNMVIDDRLDCGYRSYRPAAR